MNVLDSAKANLRRKITDGKVERIEPGLAQRLKDYTDITVNLFKRHDAPTEAESWTVAHGLIYDMLDIITLKPTPPTATDMMDRKVRQILAQDAEYQRFISINAEMDALRNAYNEHHNSILHSFWKIKDLGSIGTPEPPEGKPDKASHDRYLTLLDEIMGAQPRTDLAPEYAKLEAARAKLNAKHAEWMKKHSRKPASLEGWSRDE